MLVEQLMTSEVKTCTMSDSLNAAAQTMWDHNCGSVPVVDDEGHLAGLITDRDICMAAYTQGAALASIPVGTAMAKHVFAVQAKQPVAEAEKLMSDKRVRRLPVVDIDKRVIGLLSLTDLARRANDGPRSVSKKELAGTLTGICRAL